MVSLFAYCIHEIPLAAYVPSCAEISDRLRLGGLCYSLLLRVGLTSKVAQGCIQLSPLSSWRRNKCECKTTQCHMNLQQVLSRCLEGSSGVPSFVLLKVQIFTYMYFGFACMVHAKEE